MIIVLLHMFYLFGKHIYENYCAKKFQRSLVNAESADSQCQRNEHVVEDWEDDEVPIVRSVKPMRFSPPAFIQRYNKVADVLADPKYNSNLRKVVDFGCSELGFVRYLKNVKGIQHILCIDVDRQILVDNRHKAEPLSVEYLHERTEPLEIELCEGSVAYKDTKLKCTDAVVCIELIEHLHEPTLIDLQHNIFGYIVPKVVVITTPNADFNVLFSDFKHFRHPDHKFEWTRKQFQDWADSILRQYPYYNVTFHGICDGPAGTEEFGACTQMAIFNRHEDYHRIREKRQFSEIELEESEGLLKTLYKYEYPYKIDNRSDEEKITDEAMYYMNFLLIQDSSLDKINLENILHLMRKSSLTVETLKTILVRAGWNIEDREEGPIVHVPQIHSDSSSGFEYDSEDGLIEDDETEYLFDERFENSETFGNERDYNGEWYEEPSIVIAQNRSVNQENTYLFDGEEPLTEEHWTSEESGAICDSDMHLKTDNTENFVVSTNTEHSNNSISHALNKNEMHNVTEIVDFSIPSALAQPVASCNDSSQLSNTTQNSSVDDITVQSALFQDVEIDPTSMQGTCDSKFSLQPHLSVSRSSTSPEPLLFNIELDNSLHNYSRNDQNEFYDGLLNSTFIESESADKPSVNVKDPTPRNILELEKLPSDYHHIYGETNVAKRISPNYSEQNNSLNIEQDNIYSMKYQACRDNNDMTDVEPSSILSNAFDNHPRLTSSPRTRTKMPIIETFKQDLVQDTNEKFMQKKNEIDHETDVNDVQKMNVHCISLNDESIKNKKENGYSASTSKIKRVCNIETEIENMSDSFAQSNMCEKSLNNSPSRELLNSKTQNDIKLASFGCGTETSILNDSFLSCGNNVEAKSSSPTFGTPPDSWSHEIMDSGYPNSASAQDITPENDLSSIAQDHIPDIESPSVAEAPRLGVLEPIEVENGDLANNNRDDEGNNMMAVDANDIEGLQPLIDVIENDLENENDIYVLENGFPIWLLRILDMANPLDFDIQPQQNLRIPDVVADDANYMGHDEGFDSSSSENDSDIAKNEMENDNE